MHRTLLIGLLLSTQVFAFGQVIPFTSARWGWDLGSGEVVSYQGKESLLLKNDVAYIRDSEFVNGIIEFDINFATARGFMGAVWNPGLSGREKLPAFWYQYCINYMDDPVFAKVIDQ